MYPFLILDSHYVEIISMSVDVKVVVVEIA